MAEELPNDWWTTEKVARYLEIAPSTVRSYIARKQMPPPDAHIGPLSLWSANTIVDWAKTRRKKPEKDVI